MDAVQPAGPVRDDREESAPHHDADRTSPAERDGDPERAEVIRAARRSERSPRDMALSLLVLLIPIALFISFYRIILGGDEPVRVDPAGSVAAAEAAKLFPVLDPSEAPSGWTPVTSSFQRGDGGGTLRVGYVVGGKGVQLVQSSVPAQRLLPAELSGAARPAGAVNIDGRPWQSYTAKPGERALVLLSSNRTVIVVGAVGEERLRDLAAALREPGR
ncbi:DUF4245 domain-containing protein [Plantactinospora siamensis]|uniref:DUF4245 domain-containing protein n=1 Tax=Plantactinospora siamensis TaxID=555372 RepID=A0ABV6NWY9_9ACTN